MFNKWDTIYICYVYLGYFSFTLVFTADFLSKVMTDKSKTLNNIALNLLHVRLLHQSSRTLLCIKIIKKI